MNGVSLPIDCAALLDRCLDDADFACEMLTLFCDDALGALSRLHDAVAANDRGGAGRLAHTAKGAALNISADALAARLAALERAIVAEPDRVLAELAGIEAATLDVLALMPEIRARVTGTPLMPSEM